MGRIWVENCLSDIFLAYQLLRSFGADGINISPTPSCKRRGNCNSEPRVKNRLKGFVEGVSGAALCSL